MERGCHGCRGCRGRGSRRASRACVPAASGALGEITGKGSIPPLHHPVFTPSRLQTLSTPAHACTSLRTPAHACAQTGAQVLKVDVEGYEPHVFGGLGDLRVW